MGTDRPLGQAKGLCGLAAVQVGQDAERHHFSLSLGKSPQLAEQEWVE
jgi:hypothetical protein